MYDRTMGGLDDFADHIVVTPGELVELVAQHERQSALLALAMAHVSETGRWADHGAITMRSWMRDELRMSDTDAASWQRRGDLLKRYPAIAEAAVAGTLSASQLRELEKCNRPKYRDLLRLMQHDLVNELARLNAAETAVACDTWRRYADALVDEHALPAEPDRMFVTTRADDGQLLGTLSLDDAAGTELEKALSNALTHEGPGDMRSTARRQADALFDICAFFNLNHEAEGTPRHHPHVSLSLHANTLAAPVATNVDTGRPVAQHTANAALCDCIIHTILRDATNAPTGFGRQRYTVSKKLFKEVAARDGGCRVRGCNRLPKWCHAHHIAWWNRDHGRTDYDNLVLLCSRHHHMVHQFDLRLQWVNGWNLQITWPDGRCSVSSPRGAPPSAPPGRSFPTAA